MKKVGVAVSILGLLVFGIVAQVVFQNRSDTILFCVPQDGGVRPRNYCILNPFRDRDAEVLAEQVLTELKQGNTDTLIPIITNLDADQQERYLSNERKYRITSWRIGAVEAKADELTIQYWVSRTNYPGVEEVGFHFIRTSGVWNLKSYSAIY